MLLLLGVGGVFAPAAQADVKWLCRPGLAGQPCVGDQTTRYFAPDGSSRVGQPTIVKKPAIDAA